MQKKTVVVKNLLQKQPQYWYST